MKVTLATLADLANVDVGGKLNIVGLFSQIRPPTLPFTLPLAFLVVKFEVSPAEVGSTKTLKFVLMDSDGNQLLTLESEPVQIPASQPGGRPVDIQLVLALQGVTFQAAGDYQVSILVNDDEKEAIRLHVAPPPAAEGGPE